MQVLPGTLRNGGVPFNTTHWSIVAACAGEDDSSAHAALTELCRDYWPPLYSFARRRGYSREDAQDLVQGFFAQFLGNKAYAQTDRRKGKFRTFLLASLKHFMADAWDRERALKRGGAHEFVLLDEEVHEAEMRWDQTASSTMLAHDREYEQQWAKALVGRALLRVSAEYEEELKRPLFRSLKPFLCGGSGLPTQEKIAAELQMPIETLRSHLSRLRARYRELLRDEVRRTVSAADDVDVELRHLCDTLALAC